jgi:hypothetical protein
MRLWLVIWLFSACSLVNAQNDSLKIIYDFSATYLYSSIWTGNASLQSFKQDHPQALRIDFGVLKHSQKNWNYCNCYSRNGVSISYINFGNPSKLGQAFTLSVFAEPILISLNRFAVSLRTSAGFAFLNKVYDSISNKENIFFSTKLSYLLEAGLNASYQLSESFKLRATAQFNHISNGGRSDPNEGMNFPALGFGLNYTFNKHQPEKRQKEKFEPKPLGLMAHIFGSQRTAQANSTWPEEVRWVTGINLGLIKRIGRLNGIGGGGEIYYDGINSVFQQQSNSKIQTTVGGISVQHYLFFGKLLFGQQFAWYVTPNTGYQKNIYQRYFLEYEIKKNWYAGVTLKAHGDHSDYLAASIGKFFLLK